MNDFQMYEEGRKEAEAKQCNINIVSNCNYPWMINQNTYSVDGVEIPKGRMHKMQSGQS